MNKERETIRVSVEVDVEWFLWADMETAKEKIADVVYEGASRILVDDMKTRLSMHVLAVYDVDELAEEEQGEDND